MDITLEDIWRMVGTQVRPPTEVKAHDLVDNPGGDTFLLILYWPASASYLKIDATHDSERFSDSRPEIARLTQETGLPQTRIPIELREGGRSRALAARVRPDETIKLDFLVETDDETFLREVSALPKDATGLKREVQVLAIGKDGTGPVERIGSLNLHLEPARPMEPYLGYIALDLGNTNSAMVCLHKQRARKLEDIELVELGTDTAAGPIPSAVRITAFEAPPDDKPDQMEKAECLIGLAAMEGAVGDLVLGSKRILANPDPQARHRFNLKGQSYAVDKTLPAELFLSAMFRWFHRRRFHVPFELAITHPTTFSPWEVAQLRQAVIQGWRRSLRAPSRAINPARLPIPTFPHVIIDEASAAAFYFIYKDFIDAPGGLNLLQYLYPEGLNLLVFDCGGGTTDIALVHVRVDRPAAKKAEVRPKLTVKVLGRTGHRSFGGDDITVAAFKVLKARLAARLTQGSALSYPEIPEQAEGLPDWLRENAKKIDDKVPTKFKGEGLSAGERARRREITSMLWKWAERYKIALGKESPAKVDHPPGVKSNLGLRLGESFKERGNPQAADRIDHFLNPVEIHREEIDALIAGSLDESIEYANRLIVAKLGKPDSPGGEVHRIYLVGNASKYPLIRERIEEKLAVSFIKQRMGEVPADDLKNSVAKGAAMALRLSARAEDFEIDFDEHLNRSLPFSIVVRDHSPGGNRPLYHEQEIYDELREESLPAPITDDPGKVNIRKEMSLERLWPGDEESQPYLWFEFEDVIRGPLTVRYDPASERFLMRDDGNGGAEVPGLEISGAAYVAPMQSGDL